VVFELAKGSPYDIMSIISAKEAAQAALAEAEEAAEMKRLAEAGASANVHATGTEGTDAVPLPEAVEDATQVGGKRAPKPRVARKSTLAVRKGKTKKKSAS
jgi:hypothetical protein